jgi:hypothetical protein
MPTDPQLFSEINLSGYAYLLEISEPLPRTLRVVIQQAEAEEATRELVLGDVLLTELHRIVPAKGSHTYEFVWASYVIYAVRNESFVGPENTAISTGRHFREFSKSHFLSFAEVATFATEEYPGPMRHFGLFTESHLVDVISVADPKITCLKQSETTK